MKKEDMIAIGNMRLQGKSAGVIADALGLSVNTVKSYLRRHPDMGCTHFCPQCGKPVMQAEGRKEKKFCSDQCRSRWWNSHPSEINKGCPGWEDRPDRDKISIPVRKEYGGQPLYSAEAEGKRRGGLFPEREHFYI